MHLGTAAELFLDVLPSARLDFSALSQASLEPQGKRTSHSLSQIKLANAGPFISAAFNAGTPSPSNAVLQIVRADLDMRSARKTFVVRASRRSMTGGRCERI